MSKKKKWFVYYQSCSGCTEFVDGHPASDYPIHPTHGVYMGCGCAECGGWGYRKHVELISDWEEAPDEN